MPARPRSEVRAGVVTLAAITIAAVAAMTLPKALAPRRMQYEFQVPPNADMSGLEAGSEVLLAGIPVGRVTGLRDEDRRGHVLVVVAMEVDAYPPIYPGAAVRLVRDPISQGSRVHIVSVGSPGAGGHSLDNGAMVSFSEIPPGEGGLIPPDVAADFESIGARLAAFKDAWPKDDEVGHAIAKLKEDLAGLRSTMGDDSATFGERVQSLRDRFTALKDRFSVLKGDLAAARDQLVETRELFGEESRMAKAFVNLKDAVATWRGDAAGTRVSEAAQAVATVGKRLSVDLHELRLDIQALADSFDLSPTVANLRLAATEFVKLTAESYANPLRVLLPSFDARDARRDALDRASERLLRALDEARQAERALQALIETGTALEAGGEAALDRLARSLDALASIEQALWHLRMSDHAP